MQIVIDIEGFGPISAELENGSAAREFASLLPLSLTLQDCAATEKVSELPRRLRLLTHPLDTRRERAM